LDIRKKIRIKLGSAFAIVPTAPRKGFGTPPHRYPQMHCDWNQIDAVEFADGAFPIQSEPAA
jgi:hypothetical protein